jgi:hypothetical protein
MSVDYDIFINTEKSFSEVKSSLQKILNCQLEKSPHSETDLYYTTILGLGIGLHKEHRFFDEIHLKFSKYKYYINFDYITASFLGNYKGEWEISMAVILADLLCLNLQCECLIVRNMFTVIGKFTPDEQIITPYEDSK